MIRSDIKSDEGWVRNDILTNVKVILSMRHKEVEPNAQTDKAIRYVAQWIANDAFFPGDLYKGIMMRGAVGTGKTVMAQAVIATLQKMNSRAKFIHISELSELYRNEEKEAIENLKHASVLAIDDVGMYSPTVKVYGNEINPFADIVDFRYRNNKATIITTNLTVEQIKEIFGTRIVDRLREMCNDLVFIGKSLRR